MFEDNIFELFEFGDIPRNRECVLMKEEYIQAYEESLLKLREGDEYEPVGFVFYIVCRGKSGDSIELSWYPNVLDRYHEVRIRLPKDQLVVCVECSEWDEPPRLFVKSAWYENLCLRVNSVYCMVDAIGVKKAIENDELSRVKLIDLRGRIDCLAQEYTQILFISFADSLLMKSNWTAGSHTSEIRYTYMPEIFLEIIDRLVATYREILHLDIYAILTQGSNAYYRDSLLHASDAGNHVSLNSLGGPFADLMSIDDAVRDAIRNNRHAPAQLYMDETFYYSLKFRSEFEPNEEAKYEYSHRLTSDSGCYFSSDTATVRSKLRIGN